MEKIQQEIHQQPAALETLAKFYTQGEGKALLDAIPAGSNPLFFGMGASYHAAEIAALHCSRSGRAARAIEAVDLIEMPFKIMEQYHPLVYVSQSGESGEVLPLLDRLDLNRLIAVTNDPKSTLARAAKIVLPLCAGEETLIASKTYLNSLALLWLVVRSMCALTDGTEKKHLDKIRGRVQLLLDGSQAILEPWQAVMDEVGPILFTGRAEHAISARQASMMLAEWAKKPVQYISLGGFRHGFVELSEPGVGVVIFSSSDAGYTSELDLANELDDYGVNVILVVDGNPRRLREPLPMTGGFDPQLSPILDAIPGQLWAADLAKRFLPKVGFRHLKKVVKKR